MLAVEETLRNAGRRLYAWCRAERWPFVVAVLIAAAVHYPIYAYQLRNMDSLHVGNLYVADEWEFNPYWETEQGRWGLRLMDMLRGGINLPPLGALLMLLFYVLAGILVVRLFGLRSVWHGSLCRCWWPARPMWQKWKPSTTAAQRMDYPFCWQWPLSMGLCAHRPVGGGPSGGFALCSP